MEVLVISVTDEVDHLKNSHHRQPRVASPLLDIEPRLRGIKGRHLPALLKTALNFLWAQNLKPAQIP